MLSLSTRGALGVLYDSIRLCSYGRKKIFDLYLSSESSFMFSGRFPGPRLIPPFFLGVTYCTSGGGGGSPVPSPELVHTIVASMLLSCSVVMPARSKKNEEGRRPECQRAFLRCCRFHGGFSFFKGRMQSRVCW